MSNEVTVQELREILTNPVTFYGVDCSVDGVGCLIILGDYIVEVVEDEDDGYRSSMEKVVLHDRATFPYKVMVGPPLDEVTIGRDEETKPWYQQDDIDTIVGADGHVWLRFGTENIGDYYPGFIFEYSPPRKP